METSADAICNRNGHLHLQYLTHKGLQPETIDEFPLYLGNASLNNIATAFILVRRDTNQAANCDAADTSRLQALR